MEIKDNFRGELENVHREVTKKTVAYIVTALGLVAGLAWNDAIKSLIEYYFPATGEGVWAKIIYAVFLTLGIVLISYYLIKFSNKGKKH